MKQRWRWRRQPQLESLEPMTLMSSLTTPLPHPASAHMRGKSPGLALGAGTIRGAFFAHRGDRDSGTIYSLFASGNIAPLGPSLLNGGFSTSGFTAQGAGGGNLVFTSATIRGNLFL